MGSKFRAEIYADTRKILNTLGINQQQSSLSSTKTSKTKTKRQKKTKSLIVQDDIMQEFAGCASDDSDDDLDEIDRYVNTKVSFSKDDSLLEWWAKHSLIFPQLSLLAKSLFGVPASSATSERIFSSSGRILEKRRQSLSPDIVDDILMIRNFRNI